jgi:hypothetical protein
MCCDNGLGCSKGGLSGFLADFAKGKISLFILMKGSIQAVIKIKN